MDQIGCANSEPCYATNHGHAPGGGDWWPFAYRSLLTEMRTNLYKENQAMTTEENAECYIDLFDMMLVSILRTTAIQKWFRCFRSFILTVASIADTPHPLAYHRRFFEFHEYA